MDTLGDEIAKYLQTQGCGNFNGAGTINLFVSLLPDLPDLAVAVIERGGSPPKMTMTGSSLPVMYWDNPTIQIRVRAGVDKYEDGSTKINDVFKALHCVSETTLNPGGATFHLIHAQQSPVYLGRDSRQRHEWSQNFQVMWENPQRA